MGVQQCKVSSTLPSTDLAALCLVHVGGGLASKVSQSSTLHAHVTLLAKVVIPTQQCGSAPIRSVPWCPVLQSKREMLENMAANKGQIKLRMDQIRKTDMNLAVQSLPEPETWNVQVFRSIDSGEGAGTTGCTSADGLQDGHCVCVWVVCRLDSHQHFAVRTVLSVMGCAWTGFHTASCNVVQASCHNKTHSGRMLVSSAVLAVCIMMVCLFWLQTLLRACPPMQRRSMKLVCWSGRAR
jgi:hypothetical protein